MTKGKIEKAERVALNLFDKWNECTGVVQEHTSYYYEMQACITDAVHIGIQMALLGKVNLDENNELVREDF